MKIKKQTFAKGILTVFVSQILVKFLGFIYKAIITNFEGFGDAGNGYASAAYKTYAVLLAIATTGIPNAISKLVSEKLAVGDNNGAHKIFKTALMLFSSISFVLMITLMFGATFISTNILHNPGVAYSLMVLAPSLLFVCISAVFRGYFSGMHDMRPQGISQVIEQVFNSIFSVLFVFILLAKPTEIMAIGTSLGTTISTAFSAFSLYLIYKNRKLEIKEALGITPENRKKIIKNILRLSLPLTIASVMQTLSGVIDISTVMVCLQKFTSYEEANRLLGILQGKVDMLTNLPLAINVAFAMVLVPSIASCIAVGNVESAKQKTSFSLLLTILIALPCTFGLFILADPILKLLFRNASAGAYILRIAALATIFSAISQTLSGTLQGLGKIRITAIAILIVAIVKIVLNLILIPIPWIGINGATIASVISQAVGAILLFIATRKSLKLTLNFSKFIIKPIIATVGMCIATIASYNLVFFISKSNSISTIIAMFIAVFVYAILVILLRVFAKDELKMIPFINKFNF